MMKESRIWTWQRLPRFVPVDPRQFLPTCRIAQALLQKPDLDPAPGTTGAGIKFRRARLQVDQILNGAEVRCA